VILVTEYRFDSIVNKRNKEDLVNFEMAIKKFVNDVKIRTFPTDNFLTQYAFCHSRREKRAKFSLDLLIGQVKF
jgi:L-2-hydroxyglutarate oxidase LhgO